MKLISDNGVHFEDKVTRIIIDLLLILQQNEEFNEKYMEFRGSAVRINYPPAQNTQATNAPAQPATQPQNNTENNQNAMNREQLPNTNDATNNNQNNANQPTVGGMHPTQNANNTTAQNPTATQAPAQPTTNNHGQQHYANLYSVNKNIHYIDIELDIHVDDYDFYIKAWSQLVEVTVRFFAQFLTKHTVYKASKERGNLLRHSNIEKEKDDLIELRDRIISKFFDLLPRVEKTIRESVYRAFKLFLSVETQIKEIMQEEKLIHSFRPLLTCLQCQDLKTINEVTLFSFKKLFKLFHSCFNKNKLYNKLIEYLNSFKESIKRDANKFKSSDYFLINSVFILFTKMVSNEKYQTEDQNSINSIMKIGLEIESS